MRLTLKILIYPTPEQKKALWDLSEKCRLIYNLLQERKEAYKRGTRITYQVQQDGLPATKKCPEYNIV